MAKRGRADQGAGAPGGLILRRALLAAALLVLGVFASACSSGYQGRTQALRGALNAGRVDTALDVVNKELGAGQVTDRPSKPDADTPLLLLERAALLQAAGKHEEATRDFAAADRSLEVLDFSEDSAGELGKYLFSDDATLYKAPPHEKLMVNTMAMVSYLVQGDLEGARVEARRFNVLQQYFKGAAPEELELFALSSYLAGVTFEASGQQDEALRYYMEAYDRGASQRSLTPIAYLGRSLGSGQDLVAKALKEDPDAAPVGDEQGELVLVVQSGRAPYKVAQRFPIGAFFVQGVDVNARMTPQERERANRIVASGLLKWINFPVLKGASRRSPGVQLTLPGASLPEPVVDLDVGYATAQAWEQDKGTLMFAAFTRMIARAIAAEATTQAGKGADLDRALFPGASWLLGRTVEGALTAADTPDTRSWTMMPGQVEVFRVRLPPGSHTIRVSGAAAQQTQTFDIQPGRITVASVRLLR